MKKLLLIPLLLFCVTAFGQWTKPQLYENINTNIRLKSYSPTRISAVLDSIVATMNIGAGSVDTTAFIKTSASSFVSSDVTVAPSTITPHSSTETISFGGISSPFKTINLRAKSGMIFSVQDSLDANNASLFFEPIGYGFVNQNLTASGYSVSLYGDQTGRLEYSVGSDADGDFSNVTARPDSVVTSLKEDNALLKFAHSLTASEFKVYDSLTQKMRVGVDGKWYMPIEPVNNDTLNQIVARDFTTGELKYVSASSLGGGISDGDKGDIAVSGSGATWTVDNSAITLAKMADMATSSLIYRKTAGTGVPEVNTLATLKTDLGLTGTNSGDQTSIVGITGSLAEFNTALTGADFASGGGTATGTNTGDQSLANTSDATSHTVTLTGGTSVQLIEGSNITLTTGGTGGVGTVTIASTGGGGGITNGAAANEIMKSDGTNAVASGIESTTAGNIALGLSGTSGATRTIQAAGSASDVAIQVLAKGASDATLGSVGTGRAILSAGGGWQLNAWNFTSGSVAVNNIFGNSTSSTNANNAGDLLIRAGGTTSTVANRSGSVFITSGIGNGTNSASGDVFIDIGATTGTGLDGNIGLFTSSVADWQDMEKGIFIGNRTTAPTAGIANGVALFAEDLGSSSELYTMSESGAKYNITGLITNVLLSGTTLTLSEAHRGALIYCTSSSAVTITVPAGLPLGFNCTILQDHATGTVTVTGSGGTTINGKTATTGLYDKIGLNLYKATDVYIGI